ncbi:MAG: ABC transporter permease [Candidatus Omnitrophica bacterium]|nr:ABC transporter permease [Candidatus Omnitrophota bacterium]
MSSWPVFLVKRIAGALPVFLFLPFLTFLLLNLIPGNYFDSLRMNPQISAETLKRYESMYQLDAPVAVQYLSWLKNLLFLDFGYSFSYQQPVLEVLSSRVGNTLLLTVSAFLLAWLTAVPLGLWAGLHPGGSLDRGVRMLAYLGLSIPNFFLCLLLLWGASWLSGWPLGGMLSPFSEHMAWPDRVLDLLSRMVIPVSVLAFSSFAFLFRLMRAQVLEVRDRDFVFFLRSLRISERRLVFKHIARNAVNPLISLFGMELPALFSGAAMVEIFSGWPGLGSLMLQAVRAQDQFLVLGSMALMAVLLILGNLLSDILLAAADPRIRAERGAL